MVNPLLDLKESDIRPDALMQQQAELYAADVARLMESSAAFVAVDCPACESFRADLIFQKFGMDYQQCADCETVYVSPRPTPEILGEYYQNSQNYEFWNKHIFPASENSRREKIFKPRAERVAEICRRYQVRQETLLEVGAGFGLFCEEFANIGAFKRVIALEPTPGLAETCRNRGLEVLEERVEDVALKAGSVDVIASFEVIEHLFSPKEFVARCADLLAPGGILVLTCPNIKGFDIAVLREHSDSVDAEHLNYFHPQSLSHLVSTCGFDLLEVSTPGKLDAEIVRKKVVSGVYSLEGQAFLKHLLIDDWERTGAAFQQFLAEQGLSSHMWLVARKAA